MSGPARGFSRRILLRRGVTYHARAYSAVLLGVIAAGAALSGALLVGDSMRGSLRDLALSRIGRVNAAMIAPQFFAADLADRLHSATGRGTLTATILLQGAAARSDGARRSDRVRVIGVDDSFWRLAGVEVARPPYAELTPRGVLLSGALAEQLAARSGEDVLLRVGRPQAISAETLMGRRDDLLLSLRATVDGIVSDGPLARFSLDFEPRDPLVAFVPLSALQRALDQAGGANAIVADSDAGSAEVLNRELASRLHLADYGLTLRANPDLRYLSLESRQVVLSPAVERAALSAAQREERSASGVLAYLANAIRTVGRTPSRSVPYSTVAGIEPDSWVARGPGSESPESAADSALNADDVWLNEWTAAELDVHPGDRVAIDYFVAGAFGRVVEQSHEFTVRAVVPLHGAARDPGLVPDYPGVTDAQNLNDWDPPFPIDLKRVRPTDEDYWDQYRTAPKAFLSLDDARRLWAEQTERFGRLTSIRVELAAGEDVDEAAARFASSLLMELRPSQAGLEFSPWRERALAAGSGSTDFAGLFIGLSLFVIGSAAMLIALLFRLTVERRMRECGLLGALGFTPAVIARLLLSEGAVIAVGGALLGMLAGCGYAALMIAGLRGWWSDAANTSQFGLHVTWTSLTAGAVLTTILSLMSMAIALRRFAKQPPRALLAEQIVARLRPVERRGSRGWVWTRWPWDVVLLAAALLLAWIGRGAADAAGTFFGAGALVLIAALVAIQARVLRESRRPIRSAGQSAWVALGLRNAVRNRGRSLLTIALFASASFLIASLGVFRIVPADSDDCASGGGGYELIAESAAPLLFDLDTPEGRELAGLRPEESERLRDVRFEALRLRAGESTSCLNPLAKSAPRIAGAPDGFIERGGFAFAGVLPPDDLPNDRRVPGNPWSELHGRFADGAIPAIADEASVLWQLHSGLGRDFVVQSERGEALHLRFVALLCGSALQEQIIVAEGAFTRAFPSISGYRLFLVDAPRNDLAAVETALERGLGSVGFDAERVATRLAAFARVQNTYLLTFQQLGGVGFMLGALGLTAVLLRNVWERRQELALFQALGFSRSSIAAMLLAETLGLGVLGLLAGVVSAAVAIGPLVYSQQTTLPIGTLAATLAGVALVAGLGSSWAASTTLRRPILGELRRE